MTPVLLLLSVFLLLRGHNLPGGGFIAGLMAAAATELQILSRGEIFVRQSIGRLLQPMAGIGLLIAVSAALGGALLTGTFFKGFWFTIPMVQIDLGTPVIFDLGVFLVVLSVTTSFLLGLARASRFELSTAERTPGDWETAEPSTPRQESRS